MLIILWVALDMIYDGSHEVTCEAFSIGCSETLWQGIMHRFGRAEPHPRAGAARPYIDSDRVRRPMPHNRSSRLRRELNR